MWFGTRLSRLELLTLHSFTRFGHEFWLWAYDDLSAYDFPPGVVLKDAEAVIPRRGVFAKNALDPETGVGLASYAAPFSDLFRYKLLSEHGGIWVDMDVTCLRPFDFPEPYAFRPHRVGVVGSILKCPQGSELMAAVLEETAARVTADSEYLLPNRILTRHIQARSLQSHIVNEITNPDHWLDYVRPMIEGPVELPEPWYGIHWINEMWRTLEADNGHYRGRALLDYVPDKDAPRPGSLLWELYRTYGLIDPRDGVLEAVAPRRKVGPVPPRLPVRTVQHQLRTPTHLNILLPSLLRGGAERSVLDTVDALRDRAGITLTLFVIHRSLDEYPIRTSGNLSVVFAHDPDNIGASIRAFATRLLLQPNPVVFTHLAPAAQLRELWNLGVTTVPVFQNMSQGWTDTPAAYEDPHTPFIVGVSDAVSDEVRASGVTRPVVTVRHELQRCYSADDLSAHRAEIRALYGIAYDTLLVGMVGQFKTQKAYTRAVRVLHRLKALVPARLMIVGGWDHDYGGGRAAYEATRRLAASLGVDEDLISPGNVHPSEPYFAAFDVFLNTSIYEGLSVALLEALQTGCPVVTADAGGNREALSSESVLVADGADTEAYVTGILAVTGRRERAVPAARTDPALVPRLWAMHAKFAVGPSFPRLQPPSGVLFLTENLRIGGPQTSLVNLMGGLAPGRKLAVGVMHGVPFATHQQRLDELQIPVVTAEGLASVTDRVESILNWVDALNVRTLCFWNLAPEVKLMLVKLLAVRPIRLIDVSPGPMLFDELDACAEYQQRLAFTSSQYFGRLDAFVAKYAGGGPPTNLGVDAAKVSVIPNGVPAWPRYIALPPPQFLSAATSDPARAIGTCCRIVPDKRVEFLLEMMQTLAVEQPLASLTVVGGPDETSTDYFEQLVRQGAKSGLSNTRFVGVQADVSPFLAQFKVFVLVSDRQGCPNAALEAMAMGLPVISNRSGGVAEQIEDGVNGYLVETSAEMAQRVSTLFADEPLRAAMGRAAQERVRERFTIAAMVERYAQLLFEA